ncbi:LacI family transcriptional regulator [Occultella glacieicola]|uniref:LacI family transcriptional regulator n=1 Tax=Occultella glacieicola TaxID=2518684 RepID=A0ABY2EDP5_9MICO|nr:LacI family DNA-binding transcriptional regulator [Occultella glacieicola]TDE99052.1 LacI family transcriptional regulator [Occultella glacieicola]
MVEKTPTVYDVAEMAGVSIATVSRYFRNPDAVRESTRERVGQVVRDLGYVPSGSARGLAARRTGTVGVCFPSFDDVDRIDARRLGAGPPVRVRVDTDAHQDTGSDLYIAEVVRGTEIEAWRHGFAVMIAVPRGAAAHNVVEGLAGRVDGLVTLARAIDPDQLAHISRRIPVVMVAGPRDGDVYDHVTANNHGGMVALTDHLITEHRLTRLEFVGGPEDSPDAQVRFEGFTEAMLLAGLGVPERPIARSDFTRVGGRETGRLLLAERRLEGIDGLVCANDQSALGILDELTAAGVRVPQDLAVTGFDGIEASNVSTPRLSTVRQPMVELGRLAVAQLLRRLAEPMTEPSTRVLGVEVLLRDSCGAHATSTP